jgi:hypothetical protein
MNDPRSNSPSKTGAAPPSSNPALGSQPPPARLLRQLEDRRNALRLLGIRIPARALERHPDNIAWRIALMDRWLARDLDLAGGRHLPGWDDDQGAA